MGFHYCHACKKYFRPLGISRHRASHRDRKETVRITEPNGKTYTWRFGDKL